MATLNFPDAPDTGDIYTDSNSGFTYEWNGTVWISSDPSTASNIREIDDISSDFDGSDTTFTLKVAGVNVEPANVQQLIISVGGVMQNAGDDYTVSGSTLTFTTAPTSGLTFFGTLLGTALSLNTVADASVGSAALKTEDFTIGGSGNTVTIPGNLTVQGTETIINTNELNVQDKTIGIGSTNAPTATTQDGAGAIIYGQTHIDILYDVDKAALGISTAVNVSGFVTATRAQVGTGVTINNTGIDIGIGGIGIVTTGTVVAASATVGSGVTINNTGIDAGSAGIITAGTISSPSELSFDVAGSTETLRIEASEVGIGTINPNEQLTIYSKTSGQHGIRLQHGQNTTGVGILNDGSGLVLRNYNSSRRFAFVNGDVGIGTTTAQGVLHVAGVGGDTYADVYLSNDTSGHTGSDGANIFLNNSLELGVWNKEAGPIRFATTGTERLRITSGGGFQFSNGLFDEKCNITAGKLSDNQDIDLADGMVHYFSTQESTTATPNIRIDGSNTLQTAMGTGDVCSVTLITTAAAAGYSANLTIDGNAVTEEWVGGEAPSEGGADGLDIYTYTIICIGTGTGDSGFKVIANLTNATN